MLVKIYQKGSYHGQKKKTRGDEHQGHTAHDELQRQGYRGRGRAGRQPLRPDREIVQNFDDADPGGHQPPHHANPVEQILDELAELQRGLN